MFGRSPKLGKPHLERRTWGAGLVAWTDEALFAQTRVRVAFTERAGGQSAGPYASLNLAGHVDDDPQAVRCNRLGLMEALGLQGMPLVVPNQVHGDYVAALDSASVQAVERFRARAQAGADALLVQARGVAALLNFADCVPVVLVAPSGRFAVVHAGWRGVENGIVVKALHQLVLGEPGLTTDASCVNVYRGAYIHAECFQTGEDVHRLFVERFGPGVSPNGTHIDLGAALDASLLRAGVDPSRLADVDRCTVCDNAHWFSYRAQGGVCGRHGALCAALA